MTEVEFIVVDPELRGQIQSLAAGRAMKALLKSMELRSQLLMRRVLKASLQNPHGLLQVGIQGIPKTAEKDVRDAAALQLAVDLIRKEIEGELIQKLL